MRIRTLLVAAAAPAALAVSLLGATAASASTGPGSFSAAGTQPGSSSLIKATFSYGDPVFGPVNCQEIHHQNGTQDFDSVSCQTPDGSALGGGYQPLQTYTVGWLSDYAYNGASLTIHPKQADTAQVNLTFTVNAAGNGYTGTTASYTPPAS
jgi:hypothetical protein